MNTTLAQTEICCPRFNAEHWDGKVHVWNGKLFLRDSIPQVFHIPLPGTFKKAVVRLCEKAEQAHVTYTGEENLLLAYDPSPWKSILLLSVTNEVPGADMERLSGTFTSKVFDGPYSSIPKFIKEMDVYLGNAGRKAKQYYFYYPYCPSCARKYGHNYIVIFSLTGD